MALGLGPNEPRELRLGALGPGITGLGIAGLARYGAGAAGAALCCAMLPLCVTLISIVMVPLTFDGLRQAQARRVHRRGMKTSHVCMYIRF